MAYEKGSKEREDILMMLESIKSVKRTIDSQYKSMEAKRNIYIEENERLNNVLRHFEELSQLNIKATTDRENRKLREQINLIASRIQAMDELLPLIKQIRSASLGLARPIAQLKKLSDKELTGQPPTILAINELLTKLKELQAKMSTQINNYARIMTQYNLSDNYIMPSVLATSMIRVINQMIFVLQRKSRKMATDALK